MITAERTFKMQEPSEKAREDALLMRFMDMVEDATDRLKESCPHLAAMVKEAECGR